MTRKFLTAVILAACFCVCSCVTLPESIDDPLVLNVDYGMSLEKAIEIGKYDEVDPFITSHHFSYFSPRSYPQWKVRASFVRVHGMRSVKEVNEELDSYGYRPANIAELLALGYRYYGKNMPTPVVVTGSVWYEPNGEAVLPVLDLRTNRKLDIHRFNFFSAPDYYVLAIDKNYN